MPIIGSFISNEKEFAALTKELQEIKERMDKILSMIESKSIRIEAMIAVMLEKESLTQDRYDELLRVIRDYGKKRGLDKS